MKKTRIRITLLVVVAIVMMVGMSTVAYAAAFFYKVKVVKPNDVISPVGTEDVVDIWNDSEQTAYTYVNNTDYEVRIYKSAQTRDGEKEWETPKAYSTSISSDAGYDKTHSYTIVVNEFYVAPKPKPDPKPDPKPAPDTEPQEEEKSAPVEETQEEEEKQPQLNEETYVPNIVAVDKNQFDKVNEGIVPGGSYNFSDYVTPAGFASGVEKIADKKDAFGNVSVFSGKALTINRALLESLTKKNATLSYFFMHEGHLYCVTIPAGVNPNLVLDEMGHSGPLNVGAILGTTRLIK
ncbi:MAG: hypothetical protein KBT19_01705 [Lachnospiraceae bacterium]|nr:hypothetical protein [Candidatus Colinaster equi]